jgi:hypothetical protein
MADVSFNSPFEVGFRAAVILGELYPQSCDLQRLVYFDYLLIHSGDAPNAPPSLHPATPFRSEEYAIRREVLQHGLLLMASKGIVSVIVNKAGIQYLANESTIPFLDRLISAYTLSLRERAQWLGATFATQTDEELASFFATNVGKWGSEFMFMRDFSHELRALDQAAPSDGIPT